MKIKSMTASFGRLEQARLELGPGLNLLEAPNEGGKSTWCAFLRAMLYGIPTRERDRQGYIAEKNRYQPWSGAPVEGELVLTWGGREIVIRRGPKGGAMFGFFSAEYADSGEPVRELNAANCGETILGVTREVFERSAFVGQGGATIGADPELERRIAALVATGEEDVAYSQVAARLREWQRRRKHNKTGLIPKLEEELAGIESTLARQTQARGRAEEAQRTMDTLTARREALAADLRALRRVENRAKGEKYRAAQAALRTAEDQLEELSALAGRVPNSDMLRAAQGDLAYYNTLEANRRMAESQIGSVQEKAQALEERRDGDFFSGLTPDQAWQQASQDRDRAAAAEPKRPMLASLLIFLAGGALSALPLAVEGLPAFWPALRLGAAVIVALVLNLSAGKKIGTWRAQRAGILKKYDASYPDDLLARANTYREKWVAAQEARHEVEAVQAAARQLAEQKEELFAQLLTLAHRFEPGVTDLFGVSAAISRGLSAREKLGAAQVRLDGARALACSLPLPEEGEEEDGPPPPEGVSSQTLATQLAEAEGELSRWAQAHALATGELKTLGEGPALEARQEELLDELERRREEYDALSLALETLDGANAELRDRFSPALNAAAGEVLTALTGGRYRRLGLNRQFEAQAQAAGETLPRSVLTLSQGTAEQVYLAVRLAVCALALPGEDPAPLVLDDALDAFDDKRMALALDYLLKLGEERQILLFTCHTREGKYLAGRGANLMRISD